MKTNPLMLHDSATEDVLDGLQEVLMSVIDAVFALIAIGFYILFGWILDGLTYLYMQTPHPVDQDGSPIMFDGSNAEDQMWRDAYEMYTAEILPIAIGLIVLAFVLSWFTKLISTLPFVKQNAEPGRVFFYFLLIMSWWAVMAGATMFSDGLIKGVAGGETASEVASDYEQSCDDDCNILEEINEEIQTAADGAGWAAAFAAIILYLGGSFVVLLLIAFWTVRWLLVVLLGVGMPIFLALRAFKGTGIPVLSDVGAKAWDLWWFAVFAPVPAALILRLGNVVTDIGTAIDGPGGLAMFVISFMVSSALPIIAGIVPAYLYKSRMSAGGIDAGSIASGAMSGGAGAVAAGSGYANSDSTSRRGRMLDAAANTDSDMADRAVRQQAYARDAYRGARGKDNLDSDAYGDRFGMNADAGGRSLAYTGSNMFSNMAGGADRDFNAEAIADDDYDAEDIKAMDTEDMSRREIRNELAAQEAMDDDIEEHKEMVDDVDDRDLQADYQQMWDAVEEGDYNRLKENHDVEVEQFLSEYDQNRLRDRKDHAGQDAAERFEANNDRAEFDPTDDKWDDYEGNTYDAIKEEKIEEATKSTREEFLSNALDSDELKEELAMGIRNSDSLQRGDSVEDAVQEELENWKSHDFDWSGGSGGGGSGGQQPAIPSGKQDVPAIEGETLYESDSGTRVVTPGSSGGGGGGGSSSSNSEVVDEDARYRTVKEQEDGPDILEETDVPTNPDKSTSWRDDDDDDIIDI